MFTVSPTCMLPVGRRPALPGRAPGAPVAGMIAGALQRRTGLDFDLHSWRHTTATRLLRNAVPIEVVSKLLGHQYHHDLHCLWAFNGRGRVPRVGAGGLVDRARGALVRVPATKRACWPSCGHRAAGVSGRRTQLRRRRSRSVAHLPPRTMLADRRRPGTLPRHLQR